MLDVQNSTSQFHAESEGFWNEYIVWPLVSVINYFADLLGTYALGIITVTIIIRLVILPLTIKQVKSSKKMQEIQPKLKELQEKYSSKDAVTQQKYQQEMMALMSNIQVLIHLQDVYQSLFKCQF